MSIHTMLEEIEVQIEPLKRLFWITDHPKIQLLISTPERDLKLHTQGSKYKDPHYNVIWNSEKLTATHLFIK